MEANTERNFDLVFVHLDHLKTQDFELFKLTEISATLQPHTEAVNALLTAIDDVQEVPIFTYDTVG